MGVRGWLVLLAHSAGRLGAQPALFIRPHHSARRRGCWLTIIDSADAPAPPSAVSKDARVVPPPPPPLLSVRFPSGSMAPTRGRFRHGQLVSPTLPIFVLVLTLMAAAAAAVSVAATEAPEERLGTAVVRVSGPATKRVTRPLDLSTGAPLYVCSG